MKEQLIKKYLQTRASIESVLKRNNICSVGSREELVKRVRFMSYSQLKKSLS